MLSALRPLAAATCSNSCRASTLTSGYLPVGEAKGDRTVGAELGAAGISFPAWRTDQRSAGEGDLHVEAGPRGLGLGQSPDRRGGPGGVSIHRAPRAADPEGPEPLSLKPPSLSRGGTGSGRTNSALEELPQAQAQPCCPLLCVPMHLAVGELGDARPCLQVRLADTQCLLRVGLPTQAPHPRPSLTPAGLPTGTHKWPCQVSPMSPRLIL